MLPNSMRGVDITNPTKDLMAPSTRMLEDRLAVCSVAKA